MDAEKDRKKEAPKATRTPPRTPQTIRNHCKTTHLVQILVFTKSVNTWSNKSPKGSPNGGTMGPTSTKRAIAKHVEQSIRKNIVQDTTKGPTRVDGLDRNHQFWSPGRGQGEGKTSPPRDLGEGGVDGTMGAAKPPVAQRAGGISFLPQHNFHILPPP